MTASAPVLFGYHSSPTSLLDAVRQGTLYEDHWYKERHRDAKMCPLKTTLVKGCAEETTSAFGCATETDCAKETTITNNCVKKMTSVIDGSAKRTVIYTDCAKRTDDVSDCATHTKSIIDCARRSTIDNDCATETINANDCASMNSALHIIETATSTVINTLLNGEYRDILAKRKAPSIDKTTETRSYRRKHHLCYKCGDVTHMYVNCPLKHTAIRDV
ncbi:unnamed protein product [Owenia fusiformis]|uniref:Uncharacterized protein n=1 Tax=Owenia fusiformis TaxID=6347 RepID=A0A8J1Y918_OWEFU|nr:unnamed protein product [Owenia fusiformis]